MSRSRRVLGIGRMTYPDFHLLQAKESQFQPQFLGVYYGGKIKVAKIYYIDIFVYIYKILIFMKFFVSGVGKSFGIKPTLSFSDSLK